MNIKKTFLSWTVIEVMNCSWSAVVQAHPMFMNCNENEAIASLSMFIASELSWIYKLFWIFKLIALALHV